MNKPFKNIILPFVLILFVTGCHKQELYQGNNQKSIDDLIAYFKSQALKIGDKEEKPVSDFNAESVWSVVINGQPVEICKYDVDILDQKNALEKNEAQGAEVNGKKISFVRNGSFLLVRDETHNSWTWILRTFNEF